jgi:hypothetical protein
VLSEVWVKRESTVLPQMIQHLVVVGWEVHSRKEQEEVEQLEAEVLEADDLVTERLVHHCLE